MPRLWLRSEMSFPKHASFPGRAVAGESDVFSHDNVWSPKGENYLGDSPETQPDSHGRDSSALAPQLARREKCILLLNGVFPTPPWRFHISPCVSRARQKTTWPVFILQTRNKKKPAPCFLIFSFPFSGPGGIPCPPRTFKAMSAGLQLTPDLFFQTYLKLQNLLTHK